MLKLIAKGVRLSALLKPLILLPWIALLIIFASLTSWLDTQIDCFPVTVISTDAATVDSIQQNYTPCSIEISQEKLVIDSRLLNDNERSSVKTIWLIKLRIPYDTTKNLQLLPDAVVEINSFIKESATTWQASRIKTMIILFLIATLFGIVSTLLTPFSANRMGVSKKTSHILYSIIMLSITLPVLFVSYSSPFFIASLLSILTVLLTATLFQIIHNRSVD